LQEYKGDPSVSLTLTRINKRKSNLSIADFYNLSKHAIRYKIDIFDFDNWEYDIETQYTIRMMYTSPVSDLDAVIAAVPEYAKSKISEVMNGKKLDNIDIEVELF